MSYQPVRAQAKLSTHRVCRVSQLEVVHEHSIGVRHATRVQPWLEHKPCSSGFRPCRRRPPNRQAQPKPPNASAASARFSESMPTDLDLISSAEEVSDFDERPRKKGSAKPVRARKQRAKTAKQTYTSIIAKADKKVRELDRECTAQGPNGKWFTSDNYAVAMAGLIPEVVDLSKMDDGIKFAFNLMLYLGEHSRGDFYMCIKMCGYGGSEKPYKALDNAMLALIERRQREVAEEAQDATSALDTPPLPPMPHRWTEADADVGEFKTGRPNKQQRGQIVRQRQEWTKERSEKAKERRERAVDWVSNALLELIEERDYIAGYGLDGYFINSIARLEELKSSMS